MLARHFLAQCEQRFRIRPLQPPAEMLDRLMQHSWPGNVRELENAIEGVVALSTDGQIDLSLLSHQVSVGIAPVETASSPAQAGLKERVDAYERGLIVAALEQASGNRTQAARVLGLNRGTLHSKLHKYGLAAADEGNEQVGTEG